MATLQADPLAASLGRGTARRARCYHCGGSFEASPKAITASCPSCHRQCTTQDVTIKMLHWGGNIQSCGLVTIARRAKAVTQLCVASAGVRVLGSLEATILSGGPVFLAKTAIVRGGVVAPSLVVERGAVLEGGIVQVPRDPIGIVPPSVVPALPLR